MPLICIFNFISRTVAARRNYYYNLSVNNASPHCAIKRRFISIIHRTQEAHTKGKNSYVTVFDFSVDIFWDFITSFGMLWKINSVKVTLLVNECLLELKLHFFSFASFSLKNDRKTIYCMICDDKYKFSIKLGCFYL